MKYLKQLAVIVTINFIGEVLNHFIPLPVPASVYGLVIMFLCLLTGIIKLEQVEDVARFLLAILPIMFLAPSVGIIESFDVMKGQVWSLAVIALLSTVSVMTVTSLVAQSFVRLKSKSKSNAVAEEEAER